MRYRVRHVTTYRYEETVSVCQNEIRLVPRDTVRQRVLGANLRVDPNPGPLRLERDYFENPTAFFTLDEPHHHMRVEAESDVQVELPELVDPHATPPWEALRDRVRADLSDQGLSAHGMVFESPHVALLEEACAYAAPSFAAGRPVLDAVFDLMARIHRDFEYRPGSTSIATGLPELLADRRGVCQDFAHVGIGCLRALGLPARYVSGYVRTLPPEGSERLVGADASHAWLSLFMGDAGWIDLDPTNDCRVDDAYVTLAIGRDFGDVSPMKGVILGGGAHRVDVGVDVEPQGDLPGAADRTPS